MNDKSKNLQGISTNSDINDSEIKSIREIFRSEVSNLRNLLKSNENIYTKRLDELGYWKDAAQKEIITLNVIILQSKDNLAQINNWKDASERRFSALENTCAICRKDIDDIRNTVKDGDDHDSTWMENVDNRIKELEKWRWIQVGIIIALGTIWTIITVLVQIYFKTK